MENQKSINENTWLMLGENYDNNLERTSAILIKESDAATYCVYQGNMNRSEYCFNFSDKTCYDIEPDFRFEFAAYVYPTLSQTAGENHLIFTKNTYYPSYISRKFKFMNLGLKGSEKIGQATEGSLTWKIRLHCVSEKFTVKEKIISVIRLKDRCVMKINGNTAELSFSGRKYYVSYGKNSSLGIYENEKQMMNDLSADKLNTLSTQGYYLAIVNPVEMDSGTETEITFGLSGTSGNNALKALKADGIENLISKRWNKWFSELPELNFTSDEEKKAYYKCWWTVRSNYYNHPQWGFSVMESIMVYKGVWQWALPAVELYSDQDACHTSEWIKKAMDMFLACQRDDGYVTHAIYVDEANPGEGWMQGKGIVQTPHLPSVALRYYYVTGDKDSLRKWYKPFSRYYDYLCKSRDIDFENRHLWAILTSFDTGHDTAPVFQKVTYGENGEKEDYCYPTIFASERISYEISMGKISELLDEDSKRWFDAAELTKKAMDEYLWDDKKNWYGVRHQDGTLDTRVGVDGLYPFAYNFAGSQKASLIKNNFKKLIGNYGIRTLAEDEDGFREDTYWRGPAWPKSCSLAASICHNYFSDLSGIVQKSIYNMVLSHPGLWECYNAGTGELAKSDIGFVCTPGMSSNVGAGGILESIFTCHGIDMQGKENSLPLVEMSNFHWNGLRVSIKKTAFNEWNIKAKAQELDEGKLNIGSNGNTVASIDFKDLLTENGCSLKC